MRPFTSFAFVCCLGASCLASLGEAAGGFQNPAPEYRPKFRYWMPDASVSSDRVAKDIHEARSAGAGGLEFLPFYLSGAGEASLRREGFNQVLPDWSEYGFGTPAFVSLFKEALKAAQDASILLDYAVGANQGQGIPSEVSTPGLAIQLLLGNTTIAPNGSFSAPVPQAQQPSALLLSGLGTIMRPLEQFGTLNLTAVIAYHVLNVSSTISNLTAARTVHLNESSFIDLTPLVEEGRTLQWTPPDTAKTWKIFSFWEAYTNQRSCDGGPDATDFLGNGSWIVDHFSKAGAARVTDFWDQYILSDAEIVELLGSVGKYAWEDSMEMLAALYWTPNFLERFKNTIGYDLLPYLPLLFSPSDAWLGLIPVYDELYGFGNDSSVGNNTYQIDYRRILNDGYQDYIAHFQDWSHSISTEYSTQPAYNMPLQMLSDIPLVDAPEAESLGFKESVDVYRQFSGAAHLTNKSVVSIELGAVNGPAYSLTVPTLLQLIKRSLAGGFTMNVIHGFPTVTTYSNTTWPGYTTFWYGFSEMWNKIQPSWQHMKDYMDFVGRNQWVLQQGTPKVDLAFYLYKSAGSYVEEYNSTNLRDLGYTYDYIGPDNLASSHAYVSESGLGGPEYKALILNHQTVASVGAAKALIKIASNSIPMVFIGGAPNQSYPTDPKNQDALNSAMKELLTGPNIYHADSVEQLTSLLVEIGVKPRVAVNCSTGPLYSMWRSSGYTEYVYFFNDQNDDVACTAVITVSGVVPYIYNAWTGSQSLLLQYRATDTTLSVPLALKSNESVIVALQHDATPPKCTFPSTSGAIQSLKVSSGRVQAVITGPVTLTSFNGKTSRFKSSAPEPTNLTTWDLVIEDWHSAPDRFAVQTEITNHTLNNITLIPWNQLDASLNPVAGIGHYITHFTVPAFTANSTNVVGILKLPLIQNTARVFLDGEWLDPIDPVNPILTLQGLKTGKEYELRVDISTTLFNRIKAEANETLIVGRVAGKEQPSYNTRPYLGYGLVGSVVLEWGQVVDVPC